MQLMAIRLRRQRFVMGHMQGGWGGVWVGDPRGAVSGSSVLRQSQGPGLGPETCAPMLCVLSVMHHELVP